MKYKKWVIIPLIILLGLLLVGSTKVTYYNFYVYQENTQYYNQIKESEYFDLVHTKKMGDCNEYGCYTGMIKYYKSIDIEERDYDSFIVFVEVKVEPNNDSIDSTTDTYITTENLEVYTDVDQEIRKDINLINYYHTSPQHNGSFKVDLSLNNLIGKKDLNKALNEVGYVNQSGSTDGIYNGVFNFKDHVEDQTFLTYYVYNYPKSERYFRNTVKITVDFKKMNPFMMFIKSSDTMTLENEHEIEFLNE